MQGTLRVREATAPDAELLAQWALALAWETEDRRLDPEKVLAGVTSGIGDRAKARYFVAMREVQVAGREVIAQPVGMLMFTTEWSDWRCGWWWWIQSVYVPEAHRRTGVLNALYRHVEGVARGEADVLGLRLYVERENEGAHRAYEALGMEDAGYRIYEAHLAR